MVGGVRGRPGAASYVTLLGFPAKQNQKLQTKKRQEVQKLGAQALEAIQRLQM